jgi:predicted amidohydrolase
MPISNLGGFGLIETGHGDGKGSDYLMSAERDLSIGLVQMCSPKGEINGNLEQIRRYLDGGARYGVDIMCFPEMSITGYIDPTRRPDAVLSLDHPAVAHFVAMTGAFRITALAGIVEANPNGKPFITQIVARDGTLLGVYRKTSIPDDEAKWFAAGPNVRVFTHPATTFGVSLCYDISNPAVFAECARQGARIVFEAAAPGLYGSQETRDWQAGFDWWRGECHRLFSQYARENGIAIAVATQAGRTEDEDFPGGGYLFAPDGSCIAETPDWAEGVLYATLPGVR